MPNITGVKGNVKKIRHAYRKLVGLGEGAKADDFIMAIEGNADIRYLVQVSQLPAMQREPVETYGPFGVQFVQMGRYKNAVEVPITFKEIISGKVYEFLREKLKNKDYIEIQLALAGESYPSSIPANSIKMEDCWIELDGVDLSVEDNTLVRPAGTLHANWISWLDDDANVTLSMEG